MFPDFNTPNEYSQLKKCVGCGKQHPRDITHFRENIYYPDGYSNICYECEVTYKAKTTQKCIKCGNTYPLSGCFWYSRNDIPLGVRKDCICCNNSKSHQWHEENQDKVHEYNKDYRKKNRDMLLLQSKEYYQKNRDTEKYKNKRKKWILSNKDKTKKSAKKWRDNNKDKSATITRNRRNLTRGTHTHSEIVVLIESQSFKCFYCDSPITLEKRFVTPDIRMSHVDHYIPVSKGGSNDISNLVCACEGCNVKKHNMMPDVFKEYIFKYYGIQVRIK